MINFCQVHDMSCAYKHITGVKCDCSLSQPCETVTTVTAGSDILLVVDPVISVSNEIHCY